MMSQSTWFLIEGNARALGIVLDPEQQISDLVDATPAATADAEALATVAP